MSKQAVYHKQDENYRVVFRCGHGFVAQYKVDAKGTRTYDPWMDLGQISNDQDHAITVMYQHKPLIKAETGV